MWWRTWPGLTFMTTVTAVGNIFFFQVGSEKPSIFGSSFKSSGFFGLVGLVWWAWLRHVSWQSRPLGIVTSSKTDGNVETACTVHVNLLSGSFFCSLGWLIVDLLCLFLQIEPKSYIMPDDRVRKCWILTQTPIQVASWRIISLQN